MTHAVQTMGVSGIFDQQYWGLMDVQWVYEHLIWGVSENVLYVPQNEQGNN